jgi:Crinkler effector protein N-terminal domain
MAPPKPKTWLLLVNHKFQAIGECFLVNISGRDLIANLTKKVKKERRNALANVDAVDLTVWKSAIIIDETTTSECLAERLRNIKVDDKDTIEKVGSYVQVANLGLSDGQTLLVQLPGTSRVSSLAVFSYWAL